MFHIGLQHIQWIPFQHIFKASHGIDLLIPHTILALNIHSLVEIMICRGLSRLEAVRLIVIDVRILLLSVINHGSCRPRPALSDRGIILLTKAT